ncbi:hypothetical protein TNCV_1058771 [Trichonephila clavipes]|nr:hypothetical protein TNCV_1058771 [Trichonephila clavipes]
MACTLDFLYFSFNLFWALRRKAPRGRKQWPTPHVPYAAPVENALTASVLRIHLDFVRIQQKSSSSHQGKGTVNASCTNCVKLASSKLFSRFFVHKRKTNYGIEA